MGFYLTEASERVEKKNPITRARRGMRNPDGWLPVCELSNPTSGNSTTNFYVWGLDVSGSVGGAGGVGGLLSMTRMSSSGTSNYYYCADGNGNITDMVDANGSVVAHYEYSPFGETLVATGPMAAANPWRFSTRYYDTETGLIMYPRRPYSSTLGRFLCKDPIGEDGGVNLYVACGNDMLDNIDPYGLAWVIKRDKQFNWAVAHPTDDADTFQTLAKLIKLNYDERTKWLKYGTELVSDSDTAKKGCRYGVPNVLGFYTSKQSKSDVPGAVVNNFRIIVEVLAQGFENDNYKVVFKKNASSVKDFKDLWTLEGIYGVFYAGHGGLSGLYVDPDGGNFVFPNQVSPTYKLAIGAFYACESDKFDPNLDNGKWRDHIAIDQGGMYVGFPGLAWWWTKPVTINPIKP